MCNTLLFHGNNGYANAPQCYVIRALPVMCKYTSTFKMFCHPVQYRIFCMSLQQINVDFVSRIWVTWTAYLLLISRSCMTLSARRVSPALKALVLHLSINNKMAILHKPRPGSERRPFCVQSLYCCSHLRKRYGHFVCSHCIVVAIWERDTAILCAVIVLW